MDGVSGAKNNHKQMPLPGRARESTAVGKGSKVRVGAGADKECVVVTWKAGECKISHYRQQNHFDLSAVAVGRPYR